MDIEGLLKSLNAHSVEYVLIGATAFPVHGYARATLDIDVFIRPTPENARRTRRALTAFGYDLENVTDEELLTAGRPKDLEDLRVLRRIRGDRPE